MIRVSIVGGSGYTGGELLRLLLAHGECDVRQVTSERFAGKTIHKAHPNLRGASTLKFCALTELEACDVLFLCLPHGGTAGRFEEFSALAPKIIDLSADFRLADPEAYIEWYGQPHPNPGLLGRFVYGIPEINRLHPEISVPADACDGVSCATIQPQLLLLVWRWCSCWRLRWCSCWRIAASS